MFRSSRPTASRPRLARRLTWVAGSCVALLSLAPAAAIAKSSTTPTTCEGQVFSQPFLAYGDSHLYTLAPGGEFNNASEGWTLSGGASLIATTRPEGAKGNALNLPKGAKAVSPPMCVTLSYPSARAWVNGPSGENGIVVSVSYASTVSAISPQEVGVIKARYGTWKLGRFSVEPSLAGLEQAPREVRFVFEGKKGESQLFDVYVDPRMK
jgi:hypothetical protein